MEYEYEEEVCNFKKYAKQTLDLMIDAFRWKEMAKNCDNEETKQKYMNVSNMLLNLFMEEHQNMQNIFKNER